LLNLSCSSPPGTPYSLGGAGAFVCFDLAKTLPGGLAFEARRLNRLHRLKVGLVLTLIPSISIGSRIVFKLAACFITLARVSSSVQHLRQQSCSGIGIRVIDNDKVAGWEYFP
jgi:hypothetical protein